MLKTFWRIKGEAVARRAATGRVFLLSWHQANVFLRAISVADPADLT